jgi:gluconolactonase
MWSIDVKTKEHKVLFKDLDGKYFNGPNDVWCHPTTGRLYFTDPYYSRTWWEATRGTRVASELPQCVYFFEPSTGKIVRLIENVQQPNGPAVAPDAKHFGQPNGIVGTPDGKQLYVADIRSRKTYVYDIKEDGTLSEGKEFCQSGSDGMTIDAEGNIYLTSGIVRVFDKTGKEIGGITLPESPANVCFGGKDNQTLFMTARTGFYSIKMRVKGGGPQ